MAGRSKTLGTVPKPKKTIVNKTIAKRKSVKRTNEAPPALAPYRRKRDFANTPEPAGSAKRGRVQALQFFVQKHAASHLHYDFRLELDGVLLSWAVPKGPSLDAADKRLAIHVEDHPIEYGSFEGTIPKGEYGAGTVQLWDSGTWEPIGDPHFGLDKGHLHFTLRGKKLHGAWHLIRTTRKPADEDEVGSRHKDLWLLRKATHEFAKQAEPVREAARVQATVRQVAKKSKAPPDFVAPQLATATQTPPEGSSWLHEVKFDGYRAMCRIDQGQLKILTRSGLDWTHKFGAITGDLRALVCENALIDGEIVALREDGVSDFQKLANLIGRRANAKVEANAGLVLFAFDLLWRDGHDLRHLPLADRKAALQALLQDSGANLRFSEHLQGGGAAFYRATCKLGLEGEVAKRTGDPYVSGRGRSWIKVKCMERQEFVVIGWSDPQGSRAKFGALLLGVYRPDGKLHYAGRVGTGFSEASLQQVFSALQDLGTDEAPVLDPPVGREAKGVHWLQPELVCEVEFAEWTDDDRLRHPSFHGLRKDRLAREVVDERLRAVPVPPMPQAIPAGRDTVLLEGVRLTHPDKVLYPEAGVTKLSLAQYYARVAERILPFVADRPLSLVRCPNGPADGQCFYQKHRTATMPEQVHGVVVPGGDEAHPFITIHDKAGLIALVQMGALELHPWGSRNRSLAKPDLLVFDLDPDPSLAWPRLVEAALLVKAHLQHLGLQSFLRTTGGKGLHVVVPIEPRLEWERAKLFCRLLAEAVVRSAPERYTSTMAKTKRGNKIFVDWLRNGEGATAIASWSTRARPGAPIAVPLAWDELAALDSGAHYHLGNIEERLMLADPWPDFRALRQRLSAEMFRQLGG